MEQEKSCQNCADIVCKENRRELCKDQDTGQWTWAFWQSMKQERHNPQYGCWCDTCSGFMCGCPCHKEKQNSEESTKQKEDE